MNLAACIQSMVLDHPEGVQIIAEEAFGTDDQGNPHKSKWTLYRELNPEDRGAKIGALDLVPLMRACGSVEPLHIMAAMVGHHLVAADATPDGRDMAHECFQGLVAVAEFCKAAEAGKVRLESLGGLLSSAIKELEEVFVRYRAEAEMKKTVGRVRGIRAVERAAEVAS